MENMNNKQNSQFGVFEKFLGFTVRVEQFGTRVVILFVLLSEIVHIYINYLMYLIFGFRTNVCSIASKIYTLSKGLYIMYDRDDLII